MIEISSLTKRYGSITALSNVSLTVNKGEVLGLLGQNGAGKSTLLNVITGYLAPTSGEVSLNGYDPLLSPELAKQSMGYLPERPPLYDEMTVLEYLKFVACLKKIHRRDISSHVDEIMEMTGLTEMRKRLISNLSKGYCQRVGMAQAICGDPNILILDEPTAGLDPKQISEIRQLIHSLKKDRTILFSSHILSEVQQLSDRIVILHRGELKKDLSTHESSDSIVKLRCVIDAPSNKVLSRIRLLEHIRSATVLENNHCQCQLLLSFDKVDQQPERRLFTLLSAMGIPLLALNREHDSLEAIFLSTIAE